MITDNLTENKEIAKQYKELLRISYQSLSDSDKRIIRLAFDMAVEAHSDQKRKSGEAYIFHPISVAKIVAQQIGLDATSICAALLHDVVEDTKFSIEDIERHVGNDIAKIVNGLTKISNLKKDRNISLQAENFRKMLLTLNDDVRVIIIKIADRLHNMQTMDSMPEYKQVKIASETLYIYAPLAHRIGLFNVKTELEDLSLKYTEPKRYESIKQMIEETKGAQNSFIKTFSGFLNNELSKERFKFSIKGRDKSIYSIHRKMLTQNIPFEKIYDIVENSQVTTGRRDEGIFMTGPGLIQKILSGLGIFILGLVLQYLNFDPNITSTSDSSPPINQLVLFQITIDGIFKDNNCK